MKDFEKALSENEYLSDSFLFDEKLIDIPIVECGEELVEISAGWSVLIDKDLPHQQRYLRKTVADRLEQLSDDLSDVNWGLIVVSAYRSLSEQKRRFEKRIESVKEKYPDISEEEARKMANVYTAGIPILAAHTAGAAVDVLPFYHGIGRVGFGLHDMGVPYAHGGKESTTDYPFLSEEVKTQRKTLKNIMEEYGFTNYPFEYWHFSIGDVCDAAITGKPNAIYGPVEFDPVSKKHTFLPSNLHGKFLSEIAIT